MINADEIVPGLWQGALPPKGEVLTLMGYECLVLAAIEFQLPKEWFPGLHVIHAPNEDDGSPLTKEQLGIALAAAQQVALRVQDRQKVLVTCAQGINRSGLITALALRFMYGWPGERCIKQVRTRRLLNGGRQALSNEYFTQALRRLV